MSNPLPDNNYGRLSFYFSGANLPTGGMSSVDVLSAPSLLSNPTAHAAVGAALTDLVQLTCTSDVTAIGFDVKQGPESSGPTWSYPLSVAGATGADTVPPNTSMLVRKTISGASNKFAGRFFWPGLSEGNVLDSGLIASEALSGYQDAWDDFYSALVDLTYFPTMISIGGGVGFPNTYGIEAFQVQAQVATQRRRLRR